ncbi:MAG: cation transporter [Actinomycetota bacterium]|nr:cation transporter [Actinomycetota bacterium]
MRRDTITVPEIHCGHCGAAIEGALSPLPGVEEARVDVDGRTVTVTYDEAVVGREQLITAIEDQGYDVPA